MKFEPPATRGNELDPLNTRENVIQKKEKKKRKRKMKKKKKKNKI